MTEDFTSSLSQEDLWEGFPTLEISCKEMCKLDFFGLKKKITEWQGDFNNIIDFDAPVFRDTFHLLKRVSIDGYKEFSRNDCFLFGASKLLPLKNGRGLEITLKYGNHYYPILIIEGIMVDDSGYQIVHHLAHYKG